MRRTVIISVLVFFFTFTAFAQAVEKTVDHSELRTLKTKVTKAINNRDINTLRSYFTKEFSFTTIDQTVITNEKELQSYYDKMFVGEDAIVESLTIEVAADIETRFTSEKTGYNYGSTIETYKLKSGKSTVVNSRWSACIVKEEGQWKIASAHTGVNFMDNPYLHYKSMSWFDRILVFLNLTESPVK